jgi:predicted DNA binding CopG/RHH family protein
MYRRNEDVTRHHRLGLIFHGSGVLQEKEIMNEEELAAYYEQHKDDPDVWEEVEHGPVTPKEGLGATITVRFSASEASAIRAMAQRRQMTYSQLIRAAMQEMMTPTVRVQISEATLNFEISAPLPAQRIEFNYANEEQRPALRTGTHAFAR